MAEKLRNTSLGAQLGDASSRWAPSRVSAWLVPMVPSPGTLGAVTRVLTMSFFSPASQVGESTPGFLERGASLDRGSVEGALLHMGDCEERTRTGLGWLEGPVGNVVTPEISKTGRASGRDKTATHTMWPLLQEDSKKATFPIHSSWALLGFEGHLKMVLVQHYGFCLF